MFDILEMPWTWPVEINYHEAKAYCAWKGKDYRLLTEAEHNAIRGYQVHACICLLHKTVYHFLTVCISP